MHLYSITHLHLDVHVPKSVNIWWLYIFSVHNSGIITDQTIYFKEADWISLKPRMERQGETRKKKERKNGSDFFPQQNPSFLLKTISSISVFVFELLTAGLEMQIRLSKMHLFGRKMEYSITRRKKATIHQVTTVLTTSKNVLFPGPNHLLTTGTDDLTLWLSPERQWVKGHQYRWSAGSYDLEIGHFRSG